MFGFYWFDWTIIIVLPAMIFAFWAQFKVNSTFEKYSKTATRSGKTAYEAARALLDANGLYDVGIERVRGQKGHKRRPQIALLLIFSKKSRHDIVL